MMQIYKPYPVSVSQSGFSLLSRRGELKTSLTAGEGNTSSAFASIPCQAIHRLTLMVALEGVTYPPS